MTVRSARKTQGFTLLEAVVALVILSTSAMAIYSWLSTSLDGLRRVDDTMAVKQVADDLSAFFRTVSITSDTDQELILNGYDIDWSARLIEPKQLGRHSTGVSNAFEIGLYRLDVRISRDDREIGAYQTRVVSYQYHGVIAERSEDG